MRVYLFLQVSTGTVPVSLIYLTISLPKSTKAGNPLLYTTSIKPSPVRSYNQQFLLHTMYLIIHHKYMTKQCLSMWKLFDDNISCNRLKKSIVQTAIRLILLRSVKKLIQPNSQRRVLEEQRNWSVLDLKFS